MRGTERLRLELKDSLELVLLPGLAAVLPWNICFRLFKVFARWPWLYRSAADTDLQWADSKGFTADKAQWLWERKLTQLVDHADHYLHRTRSDAWMQRHVTIEGQWDACGIPGFLFTFHWGAGMWGLRHAHSSGLRMNALSASFDANSFKGRTILGWYVRARLVSMEQALGRPLVFVPKGLRKVKTALQKNEQILALLDVPQDQKGRHQTYQLLGESINISSAIPDMAAAHQRPYAIYVTGLNVVTGARYLNIHPFPAPASGEEAMSNAVSLLDRLIQERPAAWHFWGQWPRFGAK